MTLPAVLRAFAFGALGLNALTVTLLVLRVRRGRSRVPRGLLRVASEHGVALAAACATAATVGSLYLSEVADLVPCRWCWFQRVAMYPLALVLVIAAFAKDRGVRRYGIPLGVIGAAMSAWHCLLQWFPSLEGADSCSITQPCAVRYANEFGFVSIPYMAGSVFLATVVLLASAQSARS